MTRTSHCNFILFFAAIACVTIVVVVVRADTANENNTVLFSSLAVTVKKNRSITNDLTTSSTNSLVIEINGHKLSPCGYATGDPASYPSAFVNAQHLFFSINTPFIYRSKYRNENVVFTDHRYSG